MRYFYYDEYYRWTDNWVAEGVWDKGKCLGGTIIYADGIKFVGDFEFKRMRKI